MFKVGDYVKRKKEHIGDPWWPKEWGDKSYRIIATTEFGKRLNIEGRGASFDATKFELGTKVYLANDGKEAWL